jgi:hypothetical protein
VLLIVDASGGYTGTELAMAALTCVVTALTG